MNNETYIWNWFKSHTKLNDYAVAGIMGNIEGESGGESMRRQGDFSSDRSVSKAYAAKVDAGNTTEFCSGVYGFGLCQWTYPARCKNLIAFAKEKGKSVGDMDTQLEFIMEELTGDYKAVYNKLLTAASLLSPVTVFCEEFEIPANASAQTKIRYTYAEEIYERNKGTGTPTEAAAASTSNLITEITNELLDIQSKVKELIEKCQTQS